MIVTIRKPDEFIRDSSENIEIAVHNCVIDMQRDLYKMLHKPGDKAAYVNRRAWAPAVFQRAVQELRDAGWLVGIQTENISGSRYSKYLVIIMLPGEGVEPYQPKEEWIATFDYEGFPADESSD